MEQQVHADVGKLHIRYDEATREVAPQFQFHTPRRPSVRVDDVPFSSVQVLVGALPARWWELTRETAQVGTRVNLVPLLCGAICEEKAAGADVADVGRP
jgi:hypothetical protein